MLAAVAVAAFAAAIVASRWVRQADVAVTESGGERGSPAAGTGRDGGPPVPELVGPGPELLRGAVVDAGGAAIAGAVVTARPESGDGDEPVAAAGTGADGSFELRGLSPGVYRLAVEGVDLFPAEVRFIDVPGRDVRVVVARRVAIHGRVTESGAPVAGAVVAVAGGGALDPIVATTDDAGAFAFDDLVEGDYRAWAYRGDRAARAVLLDRFGAGPFDDVELALEPAAVVTGTIIDRDTGAGLAGTVRLVDDAGVEPPRAATTDADGRFRVEGVPHGAWIPEAEAPGYVALESLAFETERTDRLTIKLARGGVITGRVVDGGGAPVAGARVAIRGEDLAGRPVALSPDAVVGDAPVTGGPGTFVPRGELGVVLGPVPPIPPPGVRAVRAAPEQRGPGSDEATAPAPSAAHALITDADGRFRAEGVRPGRYAARATAPGFAPGESEERSLALGGELSLPVVLSPGVVVFGEVVGADGQPVGGAVVSAEHDDAPVAIAVTAPDGRYELAPLARPVTLRVRASGYAPAERDVAVRAGREAVRREERFVLGSADAVVEGRVFDPLGFVQRGARVSLDGKTVTTDDGGRFAIAGVPDGEHEIVVRHDGYPPLRAEVATGRSRDVKLAYGGGVELDVRDAHTGAPVAAAKVRAEGPAGARELATVGGDGMARIVGLAPGAWTVRVEAADYVTVTRQVRVPVGDEAGAVTVRGVVVELSRGATVGGVVRDVHGQRVHGATVRVGEVEGRTNQDGEFRLVNVPTGDVEVVAEKGGERGVTVVPLRPGDELRTVDVRME